MEIASSMRCRSQKAGVVDLLLTPTGARSGRRLHSVERQRAALETNLGLEATSVNPAADLNRTQVGIGSREGWTLEIVSQ